MKLLILGGTQFLGRHLAEAALARGHDLSLFNRGNRPDLFPQAERLRGDRNGDLSALAGRRWDAVIDTSGYLPRQVRSSAGLLAERAAHYTFVSSISVYANQTAPGLDESAALAEVPAEAVEQVTGETYGGLKVGCERAAEAAMPGRVLVVRPGLIVGPHDPTDRFTYWPVRVAEGGEVLAPAPPEAPIQLIDVRDLARWMLELVEARVTGAFNAVSPPGRFTFGALLEACRSVRGSDAHVTWIGEAFLLEQGVTPWSELPLWLPGDLANFALVSDARARSSGLTVRPLEQTVADTLRWHDGLDLERPWRAGLAREKERAVLERWRAQGTG